MKPETSPGADLVASQLFRMAPSHIWRKIKPTWCRIALFAVVGSFSLILASSALAAPSKVSLKAFGNASGVVGGAVNTGRGLAVNATGAGGVAAGDVYAVDNANSRIQEFSASGSFVRAWGLDVIAPGEPNDTGMGFEICEVATECKEGTASAAAGGMDGPTGIAVDQDTGTVYVADEKNLRIDVFSATGSFEGAFGWEVDANAPAPAVQFCTVATGCQDAVAGDSAGALSSLKTSPAVDPTDGNLYVADPGNVRIAEYELTRGGGGEVIGASFRRAIGWGVNVTAPEPRVQVCTIASGCKEGEAGGGDGQFTSRNISPGSIAVDSAGNIYAINLRSPTPSLACTAALPCRILKFDSSGAFTEIFGPAAGESTEDECQLTYTSGAQRSVAALDVAVDPTNDNVFVLKETGASTYRIYEFDPEGGKGNGAGEKCVVSPQSTLPALIGSTVTNTHGLAVGTDESVYAENAAVGTGRIVLLGPAPPPDVEMVSAEATGSTSAKFVGTVTPPEEVEGQGFNTTWHFEYSTQYSSNPENWTKVPVPDGSAGSEHSPQSEEAEVSGLLPNTTYFVRICATTSSTVCSTESEPPLEVATGAAPPSIILTFPEDVTATEAILGARIAPNNSPTTYHFEWASPTEWAAAPGAYGHRIPAGVRQIGSGPNGEIVNVEESLSGLQDASTYHFRVVATNGIGVARGPDQEVETLNSCGLVDDRCFELVSPADKGPIANPGMSFASGYDSHLQAAPGGGSFLYSMIFGLPEATAGEEVNYVARRGPDGWHSEQVSPPAPPTPELRGGSSAPGRMKALASNFACGVVASASPLAVGAPEQVVEGGGMNLFRRDSATGAYRVITNLAPVNLEGLETPASSASEYEVVGLSPNCDRVVFRTTYRYPGLPGAGTHRVYEWSDGQLTTVGQIPGPGGPAERVAVEAVPGGVSREGSNVDPQERYNAWGAVPNRPGHVIFTAKSNYGSDSGRRAVFLREEAGKAALDISQSRTATANRGALYQDATVNGSRVFFLANYGLVEPPEQGGTDADCTTWAGTECDLYEWRPEGAGNCAEAAGCLVDLTADYGHPANTAGAAVRGILGISADGEYVYFAARAQLVPGEGDTFVENLSADTYGVYLLHAGQLNYVGPVGAEEVEGSGEAQRVLIAGPGSPVTLAANRMESPSSQVSADGVHLLFESAADVTGYESGGSAEAYLYSAQSGRTACVSCRRDGKPSVNPESFAPLSRLISPLAPRVSLSVDGDRVFFFSLDRLASGAVAGQRNLYEWKRGQISLIATEDTILSERFDFAGISADGSDVYFKIPARLNAEDFDGRMDIYNARAGGGFPAPAALPSPCDPLTESSCQSTAELAPPESASPPTSSFSGAGNAQTKHARACPKGKHKAKRGGKAQKGKRNAKRGGKAQKSKSKAKRGGKVRCVKNAKPRRHHRKHRRHGQASHKTSHPETHKTQRHTSADRRAAK